jgi:DNA-binding PucR family transcriptional regulator
LADLLETPLVDVQGDAFVAIVTADADADADELRKRLDKAKTICGVSSAMPWWQIAAAHAEARQMRGTAQRRLCTVVAGPAKGRLAAMLTTDKTRTFSRAILAPITADQRRANELLKTLRSWLANHGSWDRTATALGVHRNTVRHRLAQVEHLIERDLSDPDVRMELWFALQWTNTVT